MTTVCFLGIWSGTERISITDLIRHGKPEKVHRNQVSSEPFHSFPPQPNFRLCYGCLSKMSFTGRWLKLQGPTVLSSGLICIKWRNKMTYPFYGVSSLTSVNTALYTYKQIIRSEIYPRDTRKI